MQTTGGLAEPWRGSLWLRQPLAVKSLGKASMSTYGRLDTRHRLWSTAMTSDPDLSFVQAAL